MPKLILLFLTSVLLFSCTGNGEKEKYVEDPVVLKAEPYLGAQKCKECHEESFQDWKQSDHFYSMQKATSEFVRGDFNTTFSADEINYRFFRVDSIYKVEVTDHGKAKVYTVAYTFGWHPLQQYLLEFENGKFQTLRASWDTKKKEWFHQNAGTIVEPHDWLSWSKGGQNWNTMCSSCHSTHLQKNYDAQKDSFHTQYKEINVACESCHGPGRDHVLAQNKGGKDPYTSLHALKPHEKSSNCAGCHSRRSMLEDLGDAHPDFLNYYFPQTLNNAFYEADGQIKEEDFVYGSFLSSRMHRNHVTCVNCHNPHSGKLKKQGNDLCLQCHDNTYSTESHTHHTLESKGGQCINCHMDGKYYMGNDYRRDHSFRIPRPDQSVNYGTSNACNSCHTDKEDKWAAAQVVKWYGKERTYHFSDDLLPASSGGVNSLVHLKNLLTNDSVPVIIKATAVDYLQTNPSNEATELIIESLNAKEAMVRIRGYAALVFFPEEYKQKLGLIGIQDDIKAVRVLAFRSVIGINPNTLKPKVKSAWENAHSEYLEYLKTNADFPTSQVLFGEYYQIIGQPNQAIEAYNRALYIDSLAIDAYHNLVILYSEMGNTKEVNEVLKIALNYFPEDANFHYYNGLNLGSMGDEKGQLAALKLAFELSPEDPRYAYNYILMVYQSGQKKEAMKLVNTTLSSQPSNQRLMELRNYFVQNP